MTGDCCKCDPDDNTWISWFTCSFKFETLVISGTALVTGVGTVLTVYPIKNIVWNSTKIAVFSALMYEGYKILPKVTYSQENDITISEGINFINLMDGEDSVSASLCKLSKSITVINNFNTEQDHLRLFCSKKIDLSSENVLVNHYWGITVLTIQGNEDISKIYFLGDVNIQPEDILFGKI